LITAGLYPNLAAFKSKESCRKSNAYATPRFAQDFKGENIHFYIKYIQAATGVSSAKQHGFREYLGVSVRQVFFHFSPRA